MSASNKPIKEAMVVEVVEKAMEAEAAMAAVVALAGQQIHFLRSKPLLLVHYGPEQKKTQNK